MIRWLHRTGATILVYHNFAKTGSLLESQCEYLREHYTVISMTELSSALQSGTSLPACSAVITVDDGHRNFYQYAYPVFSKFGFQVVVYLTTGPVDHRDWLWFDRVAYAFLESPLEEANLPNPAPTLSDTTEIQGSASDLVRLGTRDQRMRLIDEYLEKMKLLPNKVMHQYLNLLEQCLSVKIPDEPSEEFALLSWEEIKVMSRNGVEFGAHSVTHPILTQMEEPGEAYEEIVKSKIRIEAELDRPVLHFSYPNGQPQDISPEILSMVRNAGYKTSVTTSVGQVFKGDDPFLLRRISCRPEVPPYQFRQRVAAF
ncbi:MAG: polysaccharide deacetylase family protein, partial [Acidobacteriaceae bacterium]|nr:polysaccharide deacetylase family protein [Acidobacteriaceae bacterium]